MEEKLLKAAFVLLLLLMHVLGFLLWEASWLVRLTTELRQNISFRL